LHYFALLSSIVAAGWKSFSPSSILGSNVQQSISEGEINEFLSSLKASQSLEKTHFLALFALAEGILFDLDSERPWALQEPLKSPNGFFANLSFDDFVRINNKVVSEIRETRHCLLHRGGSKDQKYLERMQTFFPDLDREFKLLPDYNYIPSILARIKQEVGVPLSIDFDYLFMTQCFLLDRIGIKSGYYLKAWSLREDGLDGIFEPFELKPPFSR